MCLCTGQRHSGNVLECDTRGDKRHLFLRLTPGFLKGPVLGFRVLSLAFLASIDCGAKHSSFLFSFGRPFGEQIRFNANSTRVLQFSAKILYFYILRVLFRSF